MLIASLSSAWASCRAWLVPGWGGCNAGQEFPWHCWLSSVSSPFRLEPLSAVTFCTSSSAVKGRWYSQMSTKRSSVKPQTSDIAPQLSSGYFWVCSEWRYSLWCSELLCPDGILVGSQFRFRSAYVGDATSNVTNSTYPGSVHQLCESTICNGTAHKTKYNLIKRK